MFELSEFRGYEKFIVESKDAHFHIESLLNFFEEESVFQEAIFIIHKLTTSQNLDRYYGYKKRMLKNKGKN